MKKCKKCNEIKELSKFHKNNTMKDGYVNKCKECRKIYNSENKDRIRKYNQAYDKYYQSTERGKLTRSLAQKTHKSKYPNSYKSRCALNHAIRDGKIHRQYVCSECPSTKNIQGHHDDYNKPLEVRWLCSRCHTAWHKLNTPLNR